MREIRDFEITTSRGMEVSGYILEEYALDPWLELPFKFHVRHGRSTESLAKKSGIEKRKSSNPGSIRRRWRK